MLSQLLTFIQTVNDTALRRLYFRGLVRNHGVGEASAGLTKASTGGYAFFVSARLARKALNSFIAQDKRCAIQELTVEATKSAIALPMSFTSPYRRLINLRYGYYIFYMLENFNTLLLIFTK